MEYHVSILGDNSNGGSQENPFRTIMKAAEKAYPGDKIIVHKGIYRERIDPPRGGESEDLRIVYCAADGEEVIISGSEIAKNWILHEKDIWKVIIPKTDFLEYNPYTVEISGDWFYPLERVHHTGCVYLNGKWMTEAKNKEDLVNNNSSTLSWYAESDDKNIIIYAQFQKMNPNKENVEINKRSVVFYPSKNYINYITVKGFVLENAATNWAPPSAEQQGVIGTNWSKGWIIENNIIRNSKCSGISLGKYGDEFDNTNKEGEANPYVECIERALKNNWNKENVGNHIVKNNKIYFCEQAGIVGSMGCSFSLIEGNEIHDVHVQRLFDGAEQAGIKFHGAIDTIIRKNHIYRTERGIWLDWMAQGAQVLQNLCHDNRCEDIFLEVNHGPFIIANNIFFSERAVLNVSKGGALLHNLIKGKIENYSEGAEGGRKTPFMKEHSTVVVGLHSNEIGDYRVHNNLFLFLENLDTFGKTEIPNFISGNVFIKDERENFSLTKENENWYLEIDVSKMNKIENKENEIITTKKLGKTYVSRSLFENPDLSPVEIDVDYFGNRRNKCPSAGPFEYSKLKEKMKV